MSETAKERRRRYRSLTYSPGEKIWIGIYLAFMCIVALIIF